MENHNEFTTDESHYFSHLVLGSYTVKRKASWGEPERVIDYHMDG